jgi:hypothetical protein
MIVKHKSNNALASQAKKELLAYRKGGNQHGPLSPSHVSLTSMRGVRQSYYLLETH